LGVPLGCAKCRHSVNGCAQCRKKVIRQAAEVAPGPEEGASDEGAEAAAEAADAAPGPEEGAADEGAESAAEASDADISAME
jgi:hypothetical protein